MPVYEIEQYESVIKKYKVEAADATQALLILAERGGDSIDQQEMEQSEITEYGISFSDEAVEALDIDTEVIRSEYNSDKNHEYLEAIASIKLEEE